MSEDFFRRLSLIAGFFVLLAVFLLLGFMANLEIKDLDLWLHLGTGRHIVTHGMHVPSADILSYTIAGKPWVNHEWLFQVLVYLIHRQWGPEGLITMQVFLVTATVFLLLLMGYNSRKQLAVIFALLMVVLVYQSRFTIRPDLYSLFFMALDIYILSFWLHRRWAFYAVFLVQILWSNMHGFFFLGPLLVGLGICSEWIKRHVPLPYHWNYVGRLDNDEYRRIKLLFGAVLLACTLNPLGLEGALYPLQVTMQLSRDAHVFFDSIIELQRPLSRHNIFSMDVYPFYKLTILISFLSFVFNRRRLDIGLFIFWLVFLLFSLAAVRNLVFFAFAAYIAFCANAAHISIKNLVPVRVVDKRFAYLTGAIVKLLLIVWVFKYFSEVSVNGYYDFDRYERKSEFGGVTQRSYPQKAVDFLLANGVTGRIFNDFNSGAYLVGRTFPRLKVFIDGRTEVYGPKFFKYYERIWEKDDPKALKAFQEALDRYGIDVILVNTVYHSAPERRLKWLYEDPRWVLVYFDYDGLIFLRDVPANRPVIERHRIDLASWRPKELDVYRLGAVKVIPYRFINRAYTLETLGFDEAAEAEARAALRIAPHYLEPYKILGKIASKRKDYQAAFEAFRVAVSFDSRNDRLRTNLAKAYEDLGLYDYSLEQLAKVRRHRPGDPESYFLAARILTKAGRYDEALAWLRRAHAMAPKDTKDLLKVGDLLRKEGAFEQAREAFAMARETGEDPAEVHLHMGRLDLARGDAAAAEKELHAGLDAAGEDENLRAQINALLVNGLTEEEGEDRPAGEEAGSKGGARIERGTHE